MTTLFEKTTLKGMTLENRLVRSATWEGMADEEGRPTEKLIEIYRELAQGGVGLIVSGNAYVRLDGRNMPYIMGIDRDELEADYKGMVEAVHEAGGKIAVQLIHAGGQANSDLIGKRPVAPSSVAVEQFSVIPRELTRDEISDIVKAFGTGARRAKAWGFDAVQFHAGHGYLISQFLSPHTNRRTDEYGGSLKNRCRFFLEVYRAVRDEVGPDYPVMAKMNVTDYLEGGLEVDEGLSVARIMGEAGIDAIEVSAGTMVSGEKTPTRMKIDRPEAEAYHMDLARKVKAVVPCPVIVVGGFRSYEVAERAAGMDRMDYVALCRPLIMEPDLPRRWQHGEHSTSRCISCNGCLQPALEGAGIYCVVDKKRAGTAVKAEFPASGDL